MGMTEADMQRRALGKAAPDPDAPKPTTGRFEIHLPARARSTHEAKVLEEGLCQLAPTFTVYEARTGPQGSGVLVYQLDVVEAFDVGPTIQRLAAAVGRDLGCPVYTCWYAVSGVQL